MRYVDYIPLNSIISVAVAAGVFFLDGSDGSSEAVTRTLLSFLASYLIVWEFQQKIIQSKLLSLDVKVAERLQIPSLLWKETEISMHFKKLIGYAVEFVKKKDLSGPSYLLVNSWIVMIIKDWVADASKLTERKWYFEREAGMQVDCDLVALAVSNLRASTCVTEESINFWTEEKAGREYREICIDRSQKLGEARFARGNGLETGVARIFSFDSDLLSDASKGDQEKVALVKRAINEARTQENEGIAIRLLRQADFSEPDVASLDLLLVNDEIASITNKTDSRGVGRSITVSWQTTEVDSYAKQWDSTWSQGLTIEEFCSQFRGLD